MMRNFLEPLVSRLAAGGQRVSEIVGRVVYAIPLWRLRFNKSVDQTVTDYQFNDNLRRGKAAGFKFGGLFVQPLCQIVVSHLIGTGVVPKLVEETKPEDTTSPLAYTDDLLQRFFKRIHGLLLVMLEDLFGLGDQYVIVNADGSLSVPSPDTVQVEYDPLDYRKPTKYIITTRLDKATITDEYRLDGRTVRIRYGGSQPLLGSPFGAPPAQADEVFEYANLIGRIPVVHFANDRSANETNGRPLWEGLLRLFSRYDDLLEKSLDGVEISGFPIPVFEGMEQIQETINANSSAQTESYTDVQGNAEEREVINFDRNPTVFVGKGGQFNFKAPPVGFSGDVRDMLKSLFLLMLDFTRVPEALWGGAIASSKASAEVQMPPFYTYIEGRRVRLEGEGSDDLLGAEAQGGLHELVDIWLRTRQLVDPRVVIAPVTFQWPELSEQNEELRLKWVQFLKKNGSMTPETALALSDLVDDPKAEIEKVEAQAQEASEDDFQRQMDAALAEASANVDREPPGDADE
jgi:hypothetical protein